MWGGSGNETKLHTGTEFYGVYTIVQLAGWYPVAEIFTGTFGSQANVLICLGNIMVLSISSVV